MRRSIRGLPSQEWDDLGLAVGAPTDGHEGLTWEEVVPLLALAPSTSPGHHLRLALLALEGAGDAEQACRYVDQSPLAGLWPRWLRAQVALERRLGDELKRCVLGQAAEPDEVSIGAEFAQALWTKTPTAVHWPSDELAGSVARRLVLFAARGWEELAKLPADSVETRLLAGMIQGELLGHRDTQATLISAAADQTTLYSAELLYELSLRETPGAALADSLRRRYQALLPLEQLISEAAATELLLRIGQRGARPPEIDGRDDRIDQSRAWRHLNTLVDRALHLKSTQELAHLYLHDAECCADPLCATLRIRAAELLLGQEAWSEALAALPVEHPDSGLAALIWYYRTLCHCQLGHWRELSDSLVLAATHAGDSRQRSRLLFVSIVLALEQIESSAEQVAKARALCEDLPAELLLTPAGPLLAAYRRLGDRRGIADLWALITRCTQDPVEQSVSRFASALSESRVPRLERAVALLQQERQQLGDEPTILAALAVTLGQNRDRDALVPVLTKLAEMVDGPGVAVLLQQALLTTMAHSGDIEAGLRLVKQLLERAPENPEALEDAAWLHLRAGNYQEASALLDRAARHASLDRAPDLLAARGRLLQTRLADLAAAEDSYRRALQIQPLHEVSLRELHRLYIRERRYRDIPAVLVGLIHLNQTKSSRLKLIMSVASVYRQLWQTEHRTEDAEECLKYCGEALRESASNEIAVKHYVAICEQLGRWAELIAQLDLSSNSSTAVRGLCRAYEATGQTDKLAAAYRRLAELEENPAASAKSAVRAGDLYRDDLHDLAAAEECYLWARRNHKTVDAIRRLAALARSQNRPADLAELLEELLREIDPSEEISLRQELAALYAGPLESRLAAILHYKAAAELDPANDEMLRPLQQLLEQEEAWLDLARVIEKRTKLLEHDAELLELLLKLGMVYRELGNQVAVLSVAHRLAQRFLDDPRAVALAEQIYAEQSRHADLRSFYDKRIQRLEKLEGKESQRADLHRRKGEVEISLFGSTEVAVASFTRALELRPDDNEILGRLEDLLCGSGDWKGLISVYEKLAGWLPDPATQLTVLRRAARVAHQRLADEGLAARLYKKVYSLDSSDKEAFEYVALDLERRSEHERLAQMLLSRAEEVSTDEEKIDYLLRAASHCEKAEEVSLARELYMRALTFDPSSSQALDALARIYEATESWDNFIAITLSQIQYERKPITRAKLYFKCGSVMETIRHDEERAIWYYERALQSSTGCLPALHSLRDLYSRRQSWDKVIETLELESRHWEDPKGRAAILAQIGEIYANRLGDHGQALRYYQQAVATNAGNMAATLAIFRAHIKQGNYQLAATYGEEYARQLEQRGTSVERSVFFSTWAEVLRQLGRYAEAAKYYLLALDTNPDAPDAAFGIVDLCRDAPDAYDYAAVFGDLLKDVRNETSTARGIILAASGALAEHRWDAEGALALYERAIRVSGNHFLLVKPLAELLVHLDRSSEAVELVESCRKKAAKDRPDHYAAAAVWLARLQRTEQDYEGAVNTCLAALRERPELDELRLELARSQLLLGRPDLAVREHQQVCGRASPTSDRRLTSECYHTLGLAARKAGDLQLAEASWRRAVELEPDHPYPYLALSRERAMAGDLPGAAEVLERAKTRVIGARPEVLRAEAELSAKAGRVGSAVQLYQVLTELPDATAEDRIRLAHHLVSLGDAARATALLRAELTRDPDYYPLLPALAEAAMAQGNRDLAGRAKRAMALATSSSGREMPPPLPITPVASGFWEYWSGPMSRCPLEALWRALRRPVERLYAVEARVTEMPRRMEIQTAWAEVSVRFSVERNAVELCRFALDMSLGHQFSLAPDLGELSMPVARAHLAANVAAIQLGYGPLFRLSFEQRIDAVMKLAAIIALPTAPSPELSPLLAGLSRRELRQLAQIWTEHRAQPAAAEEAAHAWLTGIREASIKAALVVTDDLASVASLVAIQDRLPPSALLEGGLWSASPELGVLLGYYLSASFEDARSRL